MLLCEDTCVGRLRSQWLFFALPAATRASEPPYLDAKVDLHYVDAEVSEIASALAAKADLAIDIAPAVVAHRARLTISLHGVAWRQAFDRLLSEAHLCAHVARGRVVLEDLPPTPHVTLVRKDAVLRKAIAEITYESGFSLVVGPDVDSGRRVDLSLQDVPWPTALATTVCRRPRSLRLAGHR